MGLNPEILELGSLLPVLFYHLDWSYLRFNSWVEGTCFTYFLLKFIN